MAQQNLPNVGFAFGWKAGQNHSAEHLDEKAIEGFVLEFVNCYRKENIQIQKIGHVANADKIRVKKGLHQPLYPQDEGEGVQYQHITIENAADKWQKGQEVHLYCRSEANFNQWKTKRVWTPAFASVAEMDGLQVFSLDGSEQKAEQFRQLLVRSQNQDMVVTVPSLDDCLDALRAQDVRVDPVIQHILPDYCKSKQIMTMADLIKDDTATTTEYCGHRVQEKNLKDKGAMLGVVSANPEVVLWKTNSILRYFITDTVPAKYKDLIQAVLVVGMQVWNKILGPIISIEQTFDHSDATHLIQCSDLSKEFGSNVAAYGEFPVAGQQRHLVISTMVLEGSHVHRLLSRFLHEMGHNMGFYHEFAAGSSGVRVGDTSKLSIMGYEPERIVTEEDIESFFEIYRVEEGLPILPGHASIVNKVAPLNKGLSERSDMIDVFADLITVMHSPVVGFFGKLLLSRLMGPMMQTRPSVESALRKEAEVMDAAADCLDMVVPEGADADVDEQAKLIAEKMAEVTNDASCPNVAMTALDNGVAGYTPRDILIAATWLNQIITQSAAIAIIKLNRNMNAEIAGMTYKPPLPKVDDPDYTSTCADIHYNALVELRATGTVAMENESSFNRSFAANSVSRDMKETIIADALGTTFAYLEGDVLKAIQSTLESSIDRLTQRRESKDERKKSCAYGFTNSTSGAGNVMVCRITYYKVTAEAKQWYSFRKDGLCGKKTEKSTQVNYSLFYSSVTFLPEIIVPAFRESQSAQSSLLASMAKQKNDGIAALLQLKPESVQQKDKDTLKRDSEEKVDSTHPDEGLYGLIQM